MSGKAILFIIFNRPESTRQVWEAIRQARPERVYIAADGPRTENPDDTEKCKEARAITEIADWPCIIKRLYRESNLGCSLGPIIAFKWFFEQEEEGIILEDDCLPSKSFFSFCSEMLDKYRNNKRVLLISGCNLGYKLNNGNSYDFSRIPNMWGWATWKESESQIDYRLSEWRRVKRKLWRAYRQFGNGWFDMDLNWYLYWIDKFDRTVKEENISWWDWQWIYFQTRNKQVSVFPERNLVQNIGFNEEATHTKHADNPANFLQREELNFPLKHPSAIKGNTDYVENYLKLNLFQYKKLPWHFYPRHYIKEFLMGIFLRKRSKMISR